MKAEFYFDKRRYTCSLYQKESFQELRIRNYQGYVLAVKQGEKFGLLGKNRHDAQKVDVSQTRFYNLVKAAMNALELAKLNQFLYDKGKRLTDAEQLVKQQEKQIQILKQQVEILDAKLEQFSAEQQQQLKRLQLQNQKLETEIAAEKRQSATLQSQLVKMTKFDWEMIQAEVKEKLGDLVWNSLQSLSRKDLCVAYRHYKLISSDSFTAVSTDYSSAGILLGIIAEREIISPFFSNLYHFLLNNAYQAYQTAEQEFLIGGVVLKSKRSYMLGNLPPLLAMQWDAFHNHALEQESYPQIERMYYTVFSGTHVKEDERQLVKQFLQQWQHPLSKWLANGERAASVIDQIKQLRNRTAHHTNILYEWQFKGLWFIMVGNQKKPGILQEIYQPSSSVK